MNNSQIMRTLHYLTDIYGPRLTGSPNHKAAAEWAVKQMTELGLRRTGTSSRGTSAARAG